MGMVAQNIANAQTTGFRRQGLVFSEFVVDTGPGQSSVSMANAATRRTDFSQGHLSQTNGAFDFAIEGPGFFILATPEGVRLTRAGAFTPSHDGILVADDGAQLLDAGGAPIFVPPDSKEISVGADGTLSADGTPLAQIGVWQPQDVSDLRRSDHARFLVDEAAVPAENARVVQGFLEASNVDAVSELARMIEVQRAYEMGQSFLEREDERIRGTIRTVGQ